MNQPNRKSQPNDDKSKKNDRSKECKRQQKTRDACQQLGLIGLLNLSGYRFELCGPQRTAKESLQQLIITKITNPNGKEQLSNDLARSIVMKFDKENRSIEKQIKKYFTENSFIAMNDILLTHCKEAEIVVNIRTSSKKSKQTLPYKRVESLKFKDKLMTSKQVLEFGREVHGKVFEMFSDVTKNTTLFEKSPEIEEYLKNILEVKPNNEMIRMKMMNQMNYNGNMNNLNNMNNVNNMNNYNNENNMNMMTNENNLNMMNNNMITNLNDANNNNMYENNDLSYINIYDDEFQAPSIVSDFSRMTANTNYSYFNPNGSVISTMDYGAINQSYNQYLKEEEQYSQSQVIQIIQQFCREHFDVNEENEEYLTDQNIMSYLAQFEPEENIQIQDYTNNSNINDNPSVTDYQQQSIGYNDPNIQFQNNDVNINNESMINPNIQPPQTIVSYQTNQQDQQQQLYEQMNQLSSVPITQLNYDNQQQLNTINQLDYNQLNTEQQNQTEYTQGIVPPTSDQFVSQDMVSYNQIDQNQQYQQQYEDLNQINDQNEIDYNQINNDQNQQQYNQIIYNQIDAETLNQMNQLNYNQYIQNPYDQQLLINQQQMINMNYDVNMMNQQQNQNEGDNNEINVIDYDNENNQDNNYM